MRTEWKTAFRPSLEPIEARIVATGGVVTAMAHHASPHHEVHAASHHASKHHGHPADSTTPSTKTTPTTTAALTTQHSTNPTPAAPVITTTGQAWVDLVNMTGQNLQYQIKLGPYDNGQFLAFDIGPGGTEYQMSDLVSNGQLKNADFAIQFGNGPVTPLLTGISQQSAQGYYIFMDSNFQYYVEPFIRS